MNCIDVINKTKRCIKLSNEEIRWLVKNFTNGNIPDYQMSAWLMAVCLNGLSEEETISLTMAMRDSGEILDFSGINGITADKHSTGGVGDKTSLIICPIAAACGLKVPKMSGRGLGHTGGTIDKLESIPGYRTELSHNEFIEIVEKAGFSIISQSGSLCPADKKIYALRNASGTVDSIPLICSSIMCKKLAMNADCILLDVKYGSGAFMKTKDDAQALASLMEKVGTSSGKKCRAIVTDMNSPLGSCVGNVLEVNEAVRILQNKQRDPLYELCIELAANMLELGGKGSIDECRNMAELAVSSGRALEFFMENIRLQGGNLEIKDGAPVFPKAKYNFDVIALKDGVVSSINSEEIGMVSLMLGAGRLSKEQSIDITAGVVINCHCGDRVSKGDKIMTLYSSVSSDFCDAARRVLNSIEFSE